MTDTLYIEQPKQLTVDEHMATVWQSMSDIHRQFVITRLSCKSDAEACRLLKLQPSNVSAWPTKKLIDEYIAYQRRETLNAARFVLLESTLDAVGVLRKRLKGAQGLTAAKEILDRAGLPAISRQEISGVGGGAIEVKAVDYRNGITALAPRSMGDSDPSGQE